MLIRLLSACLLLGCLGTISLGQDESPLGIPPTLGTPPRGAVIDKTLIADVKPSEEKTSEEKTNGEQQALYAKFTKLLTGAKMTGQYTVDGKPLTDLKEESYTIEKVEKQEEGDLWVITARIKYGKRDLTFPVPIEVKWAGTTPVLTLDDLTIPGFGTFSARVVLHKDKYAGTWSHGDVGGHLFGLIELGNE